MSMLCVNAYKSGSSKYMKERTFSLIPQYIANDIYLIWDYVTAIGNGAHEYIVHTEEKLQHPCHGVVYNIIFVESCRDCNAKTHRKMYTGKAGMMACNKTLKVTPSLHIIGVLRESCWLQKRSKT